MEKMFLLVADEHSNWMKVAVVTTTTHSRQVRSNVRHSCASGNIRVGKGTAFIRMELITFIKRNPDFALSPLL